MSTILMAKTPPNVVVSPPRKRNCDGQLITNSSGAPQATAVSTSSGVASRQASPARSDASSELTELTSTALDSPAPTHSGLDGNSDAFASTTASTKKRKLTFAEREVEKAVKLQEKEEKAKQKAEEKARKDEDRRQKDEEKRKKEEEKEARQRTKELEKAEKKKARDAEKQEKDAEKAKKEAERKDKELEKLKKEKSQMRIATFFGRPAPQSTPPTTADDVSSRASSRRSSIGVIDIAEPVLKIDILKTSNPEFERYIIPYFIHENTELAPVNRFKVARKVDIFGDNKCENKVDTERPDIESLLTRFGRPRKRTRMVEPVKEIADRIQATQISTTDLIGDYNPLASIPYKILSFKEDVRPPYVGTYTKRITSSVARKLSRRPIHRGRPDTNYDYDSEAEWEEPAADDEEILEDEMSESEEGDEEMHDFLDDEDDQGRKRMFAGDMQPMSSGLCFQGEDFDSNGHNMDDYRIDVLHDSTTFPIDPFSTVHWSDIGKAIPTKSSHESSVEMEGELKTEAIKSMPPPRIPLATVNASNILNNYLSLADTISTSQSENVQNVGKLKGRPPNPNRELKMIPADLIGAFKRAVDGSDLTKTGLIEVLKKQFPKCSKDAIKDTLGAVAVRIGKKEAEKKWELVR